MSATKPRNEDVALSIDPPLQRYDAKERPQMAKTQFTRQDASLQHNALCEIG